MSKDDIHTTSGTPPWEKDLRRVVLSDGSYVVGQTVLEEAQKCGLGTGGFTMIDQKDIQSRFRLLQVARWDQAAHLNALHSNAVVVLALDPRAHLIDLMVTRSKERHRSVRIVVDGNNVEDTIKWLDELNQKSPLRRLFIGGTGSNTVARRVCEQVLPAYSKMLDWRRES